MMRYNDSNFDNSFFKSSNSDSAHEARTKKMLDEIAKKKVSTNELYIRSLLHPELVAGAKIPSPLPQQTATAQIKYNFNITPNASGKFALVIDPSVQQYTLYNDSTVNGLGVGVAANGIFAQDSNIIDMFRVVSASLIITYTGRLDAMSGFIVGAVTNNLSDATPTTYLTFNNIEDLQDKKLSTPYDGLKIIYSPIDTSQLDFTTQTSYAANTNQSRWKEIFVVYGDNLPNTSCIRVDYVRNIEYISKTAFREYISHDYDAACDFDSRAIQEVKKNEVSILGVKQY